MKNDRFEFANALRGFAAIAVLVSHYMHNIWAHRPEMAALANVDLPSESAVITPHYITTINSIPNFDWGAYGVALFFLVSGFVIPLSLRRYSVLGFLVGRVFRIWPVYVAGFTISIASIWLGGVYFGRPFPYSISQVLIHYVPGLRDLLWSTGIDGIVWTLEIEIKFYVVCALIAPLVRSGKGAMFIVPFVIGFACFFLRHTMVIAPPDHHAWRLAYVLSLSGEAIVFMFIGTVLSSYLSSEISGRFACALALALGCLFLGLTEWGPLPRVLSPISYAAAVATFLLFARLWRSTGAGTRFLSSISYPLYVCHGVMGYAIIAVLLHKGVPPKTCIIIATVIAITAAFVLHKVIETPSHRIGQKLGRRITQGSKPGENARVA